MRLNIGGVVGELTTLPGCSTVCVSHGVYIPKKQRRQGMGTEANMRRQDQAATFGYEYMMCTVRRENIAQRKVLTKAGWRKLDMFYSGRSETIIELWGIQL